MQVEFHVISFLIVLSALFAYVNHKYIRLPGAIGLMFTGLVFSVALMIFSTISDTTLNKVKETVFKLNFSNLLLDIMLSFMLFAGAIHIKIDDLKEQKLPILLFSTLGVVIATFIVGVSSYYILRILEWQVSFIHCLLFGALIAPTDPIAVLGILKDAKVPKSLETKIAGESLFNDGIAVVVFLSILEISQHSDTFTWSDVTLLFIREAIGGAVLGIVLGYSAFWLIRSIDNYKVEILITLAVVMGGYSFAEIVHTSGPLAMVLAGIIIGNHGVKYGMSDLTEEYVNKFWELIDEILNAVLFVMIALHLLIIPFKIEYFTILPIILIISLMARYISILIPAQLTRIKQIKITHKTVLILTWAGLRGGISIALALSLKPGMDKDLWVAVTYFIVAFSILFQGLSIGKMAKKLVS
ncbi:MAG: sodium:proton antiporter [Bacteroidia bacterium]|nr:sodium:proton antiporter [Bacteroidia bacterium]